MSHQLKALTESRFIYTVNVTDEQQKFLIKITEDETVASLKEKILSKLNIIDPDVNIRLYADTPAEVERRVSENFDRLFFDRLSDEVNVWNLPTILRGGVILFLIPQ